MLKLQQPVEQQSVMTVDSLKNVLNEPPEIRKEIETQKRKDVANTFKTAPFEDLVSKAAARVCKSLRLLNFEFEIVIIAFCLYFRVEICRINCQKYLQKCQWHPQISRMEILQIGTIIQQIHA